ncbi:MAG: methyltransferase domain-containing protein [Bacteroidetes bacterium]|nr:methyltransferase domain-containing protein [Bacteroidota bacterium]MCB9042760.1 methyltransferase domain-containing protein [Chitinophagales bacterium]
MLATIKKNIRYLSDLRFPHNKGFCPICKRNTTFIAYNPWLRDNYRCKYCRTIPRKRAIIHTLQKFYPNLNELSVHESSPGKKDPSSTYIQNNCKDYTCSHFFPDKKLGSDVNGMRCENLTNLTFPDNTFDLFITQDVFEHVFFPEKAFKEIARVLKPGGAHVFTMPWYPHFPKSIKRAELHENGTITHLLEPNYHGNPISENGSLVTYDWGLDFTDFIYENSGLNTTIYLEINEKLGLNAKFLEVFISRKT